MKRLLLLGIALVLLTPIGLAERPRVYALTGGTVVAAPGETIEGGTVIVRDGLISAVGSDVAIPLDAVEVDAAGLRIYPGLIDPETTLGLKTGDSQRETGARHPVSRVHPERSARDRLLPFEGDQRRQVERYRNLGFTVTLAVPDKGIFRGSSVAILLKDDTAVPRLILRDNVAQHVAFEWGRFGEGYPTSLMGAASTFRQTLLDSERYETWRDRWARDARGLRRPDTVAAWEALSGVINGTETVIFSLDHPDDFLLADRLAREFDLLAVMSGSGDEWQIADRVASSGRTLIFPVAFPDKPKVNEPEEALDIPLRDLRGYLAAPSAPAKLHEAGVELAFTTRDLKNPADFPRNLEKIVSAGLPENVALAALTTVPARILGVQDSVGTLQTGKIANLVVMDGSLFSKDSRAQRIYVDGIEYRVEEKKKPKGDPNAVVDPRGEWSVVFEFGGQTIQRTWTVEGVRPDYTGTAETRSGTVTFDRVELQGNAMTVTFPSRGGFGPMEITVIIEGDTFEGVAEMGSRSAPVRGTRTSGPEGGQR